MNKVELKFVADIVGHDEATIIQMYYDWLGNPFNYRNNNSSHPEPPMNEEKTFNPTSDSEVDDEKLVMLQKCWIQQKPDYACIFVTKHNSGYNVWRFCWEIGEPPENATDETIYWYLSWTNQDGDEWDDIAECDFDEYLILEILPTMDEVHKQWVEKQSKAFLST